MISDRFKTSDFAAVFGAFQVCFNFLSRMYLDNPEEEFINTLIREDLLSDWPISYEDENTAAGLEKLGKFLKQWDPKRLQDLQQDYTRLFIGIGSTLAPPYESVYLGEKKVLFERQIPEVRRFYEKFRLQVNGHTRVPDDHIGYELYFIAYLCSAGFHSSEIEDEAALKMIRSNLKKFLREHLMKWIYPFIKKVTENAQSLYYQGAALLTLGAVENFEGFIETPD